MIKKMKAKVNYLQLLEKKILGKTLKIKPNTSIVLSGASSVEPLSHGSPQK